MAVGANDADESMYSPSPRSSKIDGQEFFCERSGLEYKVYLYNITNYNL